MSPLPPLSPALQQRLMVLGGIALAVLIVLANTVFIIGERKQAVVLRLGEPVRVINAVGMNAPGLKAKAPFLENVVVFDKRNQAFESEEEEIITANQERLVVDAFVRYRIRDPLQFYTTLRDEAVARDRLERLVNSSLRQQLGAANSEDIIAGRRGELTRRTLADVAQRARASRFGVEIIDVRIKRADLPQANQVAVFERMKTARQQEAAQIRAVGEQRRREIVATATEEAERTRGQGDAERARIFASSFGRDPNFAAFYRSMKAYETSLGQGDATLVLSPDSAFFRYFSQGPGQ